MLTRSTVCTYDEVSDIEFVQVPNHPMTVLTAVTDFNESGIEWYVCADRDGDMMVAGWDLEYETWEVLYIG